MNDLERPSEAANFRLAEKDLQKSKAGRLVITPTGFGGSLIFFIRGNGIRSFSPNYNVELIYGGKEVKSLISRVRSRTLSVMRSVMVSYTG